MTASNEALRRRLLEMKERDERLRVELALTGELFDGYVPEMEELHCEQATALEAIVDEHGWPRAELAGEDGCEAAFLVAQHSISRPELQRRFLAELSAATDRDQVPAWQRACLEDRIRFNEGRPQLYGTVLDWDREGELTPGPIETPEEVDPRRAVVGLPPLAEWLRVAAARARKEGGRPPADADRKAREVKWWARRVGWR